MTKVCASGVLETKVLLVLCAEYREVRACGLS